MFALQSDPISIGTALFLVGLFVVGGIVLGAVGSAVAQRLSDPVTRYRQLYLGVIAPFALLAYVVFRVFGVGFALVGGQPGVGGTLATTFLELFAGGFVGLAAYTPTVSGVRRVRDIELSTKRAALRMGRYVFGLSAVATVVIAPLELGGSTGVLLGLVAVGIVGMQAAAPWLVPAIRSTRRPDNATVEHLDSLRQRAGLAARDVRILDTDKEETAGATVRGIGRYQRLFVTSTFLDSYDDETATALLAVQAGRQNARVLPRLVIGILIALAPLFAAIADIGPLWPLIGVSLGLIMLALWLTRRGVRAADDYAAERVGSEMVAIALEQYAAVHDMEPSRRRFANPFSKAPPLGNRIDRLRERTEAE